ncbi:katanin p80 WD40 repeat-containing subunit B1-like isoform X2 [Centruroides vittatus]|uniref:katanin p80 WD40 repeat-containing subunit B1-like isoform X2 n=1 Tax=Centruroides vittatus TaxID=120091 RepID=UPI00350FBEEE
MRSLQSLHFGLKRRSLKKNWKECTYSVRWEEFQAHTSNVTCLDLGRKSGRVMVTGGEDRKVNLWAVGKPNCIMSLTGHTTSVECVKFGQLEDLVCAGSASGTLKIWDLEAAKIVRTLSGHKGGIKCLDFHPYGDFVASGSSDTNIKMWDVRKKGCINHYKGHCKSVNSLQFSPDGRWIASGGDDGMIKLWDLPAGKVLTEFQGHSNAVTDVEFHPNEFLLATGSADRTVKFWDLESFQMVSSTDGDSGPVRCIYFHPDGECLFSGAHDLLKVYGWEPNRTFDTLVMGWGKVADITISQNQLIAGTFNSIHVSVYVVDLKRVQPFAATCSQSNIKYVAEPPYSVGNPRKSFEKEPLKDKSTGNIQMKIGDDLEMAIDDLMDDSTSFADINDQKDYNAIFHSKREYPLKNVNSKVKTFRRLECSQSPFLPPVEIMTTSSERKTFPTPSTVSALGITYARPADPFRRPSLPSSSSTSLLKPLEKSVMLRYNSCTETSAVSVVRPVPIVPAEKDVHPKQAIVFPELQQRTEINYLDFVPDQREHPFGLDLEEFLPRHLQDTLRLGGSNQPEMSEAEAMSCIIRGHQPMIAVMSHRHKNLQIILAQWNIKDMKIALESAVQMNNQSIIVDILNVITLRPSVWNLDACQILLPPIYDLLQSKYEAYMTVGCNSLKLILKNFASVIKSNINAPPGVGVDITREERYNKCMSCYNQLLSIRSFLLKRQTLQGKLGQSFRELHILMQCLE